jgi:hypothetical protein
MTSKTFIRLMFLLMVATSGLLLFATPGKKPVSQNAECPAAKEKQDDNQAMGDMMIWESVSRHLISSTQ